MRVVHSREGPARDMQGKRRPAARKPASALQRATRASRRQHRLAQQATLTRARRGPGSPSQVLNSSSPRETVSSEHTGDC